MEKSRAKIVHKTPVLMDNKLQAIADYQYKMKVLK